MGIIDPKKICQIALVVKDIEKVAKNYAELFGVDVPEIEPVPPQEETHIVYRGKPSATRAKLCVFDLGSVVLELSEPDELPSSWKEFLDKKGEGVHHIGFQVEDRAAVLDAFAKRGIPVRHVGEYPGGTYTFMDSEEQFGVVLNLKHEPKE